ncbi:MAG: DUF2461 domain-containing protein [bacterium]|nr:DUF2461 domain-containing protein [bacterium]
MQSHFTPELFEFLLELRANNDRDWFGENKARYERHVKEPLLAFIEDFEPYLHSISEHFVADARANGGSMFRIYRDVRFSKDKSPYKTQAAAHFRHEVGKSVHAPGFYLHLEPGLVFAGVGLWRPDSAALGRIRECIVDDPAAWEAATGDPGFVEEFDLEGESLKRPPKGFDPEHPLIEDLRRKDHVAMCMFDEDEATAPGFIDVFADACRTSGPYMEFLTRAVGLPY